MYIRKLILFLALVMPAIFAIAQSKNGQTVLFFKSGGGIAQRLAQHPAQLDASGKVHYSNLRSGINANLQLGYSFTPETSIALVYSRF